MKYYIIAGEASGDLHGSNLMKGIYAEDPQADIRFWGGDCMDKLIKQKRTPKHSHLTNFRIKSFFRILKVSGHK